MFGNLEYAFKPLHSGIGGSDNKVLRPISRHVSKPMTKTKGNAYRTERKVEVLRSCLDREGLPNAGRTTRINSNTRKSRRVLVNVLQRKIEPTAFPVNDIVKLHSWY